MGDLKDFYFHLLAALKDFFFSICTRERFKILYLGTKCEKHDLKAMFLEKFDRLDEIGSSRINS